MLTDKQFLRYQRQLSLAELGEEGQQKLLNSRVLIVGCGGLGNVVAPYLVGAGIGQVIIADGDRLELHNLHRQICYHETQIGHNKAELLARHLRELNSEVRVRVIAPVVGMIANGQALIARHALVGSAHFPANQLLRFDGKSMNWQNLQLHQDKVCPVCRVSSPAQQKEPQPC